MATARQLFLDYLAPTSNSPLKLEIEKAEGCWLISPEGRKYLDLISGISVSNIGHNNPQVVKAVHDQAGRHMHLMVYGEFIQQPQVILAQLLCSLLPGHLNSVFYTGSGSEAVEGAIKLARRFTGRHEIIAFRNAYHGSTMGALSITGCERQKRAFRPLIPSVRHIDFNSREQLDAISVNTACVIAEPVQGEAGVILPSPGFLDELRARCNETGALLIFDEIQTGFGRTGHLFAMDRYRIYPDIVLFAKGLGGGMPLGAFISEREIMKSFCADPALGHITTFGGHPVSCAAAIASIGYIVDNSLFANAEKQGAFIKKMLDHSKIREVRGEGLMIALDLGSSSMVRSVIDKCIDRGVVTDWFLFNERSIRICPPLIIERSEAEHACDVLLDCLDKI